MSDRASVGHRVGTYLVLTFAFSSYFYFRIIHAGTMRGGGGLWVAALMWCPAAAAIAASMLTQRRLSAIGWRWSWRYVGLAYAIPLAYASVAYGATWALGLGRVPNPAFLAAIAGKLHLASPGANVAGYLALQATVGMVFSSLTALGEEIGWRGFLVPELARAMPLAGVAVVSGVVWASWHVPVLLFADYHGATPSWYSLLCFSVLVLGASFVLAWLRLRSGSVWPAVIFHASHNLWIQTVFDPFTADTGRTAWIIGEFGAALALTGAVAGWLAWRAGVDGFAAIARSAA
ncbi:MAG TPA: CPBP family intramembrane glutamic endopeptidase [Thermoanaerobaculia bacterium]|nr:CPBP family intramembrane glutamic endopeptidase [Thermoanaerobaculia bacterium]